MRINTREKGERRAAADLVHALLVPLIPDRDRALQEVSTTIVNQAVRASTIAGNRTDPMSVTKNMVVRQIASQEAQTKEAVTTNRANASAKKEVSTRKGLNQDIKTKRARIPEIRSGKSVRKENPGKSEYKKLEVDIRGQEL